MGKDLTKMYYQVNMGSEIWAVPVSVIIDSMKAHYGEVEADDLDEDEIVDWAKIHTNWSDVEEHAKLTEKSPEVDREDMWVNGDSHLVEFI